MITYADNEAFKKEMAQARDFDLYQAVKWIREKIDPADVFEEMQIDSWAYHNDFTRERDV